LKPEILRLTLCGRCASNGGTTGITARAEDQAYLFAPAACAFDYPVATYYSKIPSHERDEIEAALALSVETIDQQWFNSSTDLITERNRLLSRLRLVVHGRVLAGGRANLLLPAIEPPDA
jgi:hypothetical protein